MNVDGGFMKLYLKQKVFSFSDKYDVFDENENVIYNGEAKLFSFGAKIRLLDNMGEEKFYIEQKLMRFLPEYHIFRGEVLCAVVKKEFSFFTPKINVSSDYGEFVILGDFFSMNFSVECNGEYIGCINKKWLSWGDTYELDISDSTDPAFFCSLVIAIDNCLHNENNN